MYEMPIGLTMALALNPKALEKFTSLTEKQKKKLVKKTKKLKTECEMQRYVEGWMKK